MPYTDRLLRTSEVAEKLGVDAGTVGRYIKDRLLPAHRTAGGHFRVYESDVRRLLSSLRIHEEDAGAVIVAVVNQKGGVGKTTATVNLAVLLSKMGLRVLAVDLDPQGHLSWSLGHNPDGLEHTIYNAMVNHDLDLSAIILKTRFGPDLAPNNIMSSVSEEQLRGKPNWGMRLAKVLRRIRGSYDYILIDSGPNMGVLTINCLQAADYVLIPTQFEVLSVKGLQLLLSRIDEALEENPGLRVAGAVGMMAQPINANRSVEQILRTTLSKQGIKVFDTMIQRASQFADVATSRGVLVDSHPRSKHAEAYSRLLAEILSIVGGAATHLNAGAAEVTGVTSITSSMEVA